MILGTVDVRVHKHTHTHRPMYAYTQVRTYVRTSQNKIGLNQYANVEGKFNRNLLSAIHQRPIRGRRACLWAADEGMICLYVKDRAVRNFFMKLLISETDIQL